MEKARAKHKLLVKKRKQESFAKYIGSITVNTSTREVWEKIRNIRGREPKTIRVLKDGDLEFATPPQIAEKLGSTMAHISSNSNYSQSFLEIKENS